MCIRDRISTIHALAARICRDFYDLAGIPADFRMLDETDAELLLAGWFDEAMAAVEPGVVGKLGYTWLRGALRMLLADPFAAEDALKFGEAEWRKFISDGCEKAIRDLIDSDCWQVAEAVLSQYQGAAGDKLEDVRLNVIAAMADILERRIVAAAFGRAFAGFRSNGGAAKNWPQGLTDVRECLVKLRDAFRNCQSLATLEFGPADLEACRRVELLRRAFESGKSYIAKVKLEKKVLDFGDLETYALRILQSPTAREHYAERWKAILVDEFQDTNPVQEKLLQALTSDVRLTIVGDNKQSIYGFRRADTRVFDRFRERIVNEVVLSKTFRTHAALVEPMNRMFEKALGDLHQPLEAAREWESNNGEQFIIAVQVPKDANQSVGELRSIEARYIAAEIRRLLDEQTPVFDKKLQAERLITPGDIAILSRTRSALDVYIEALTEAGVPAVNTGGGDLLETREAKDARALLQFAADPHGDDVALAALLRGPMFAVSDVELYRLSKIKNQEEKWWPLLNRAAERDSHAGRACRILNDILAASKRMTAVSLLEYADELTAYTAVVAHLEQGERRLADWFGFLALLRRFASLGRSDVLGVANYLREIQVAGNSTQIPRPPLAAGDAVSLMTIHGSKGLEWPVVFVPDLARQKPHDTSDLCLDAETGVAFKVSVANEAGRTEKQEPAILRLMRQRRKEREAEEAKRVLYVAITRARDRVYLTAAGDEGPDLEILRPGLEAAGIPLLPIAHDQPLPQPNGSDRAASLVDAADPAKLIIQTQPIAPVLKSVAVTGLAEYALCPKRFKFQFVDGHPGVGKGSASARTVGSLTHTALEMGFRSADKLEPFRDGGDSTLISEALDLANRFDSEQAFEEFRLGKFGREVPLQMPLGDITLVGKADLVGEDYVLDFKTDSGDVAPEHHALQLWAYATALRKPRAVVAYLRHARTHEYTEPELQAAASRAQEVAAGIIAGSYPAKPSERACYGCLYGKLCDERVQLDDDLSVEDVF